MTEAALDAADHLATVRAALLLAVDATIMSPCPKRDHARAMLVDATPAIAAVCDELDLARAQICRLVSGQALESDHLCQHLDADVAALAEVAALRQELAEVAHMLAVATSRYDACVTKLAEARRLGLEACAHARALARGAPDVSTRDESVDAIVDALEAL